MESLAQPFVDFLLVLNDRAAALDGRVAFVLGICSWFAVEFLIRRLASTLRWAILLAVIAAAGLTVTQVFRWIGGGDLG